MGETNGAKALCEEGCVDGTMLQPWPQRGAVAFRGVVLRYRLDHPPALNGLHLELAPGEKLGLVGRTGEPQLL